MIRFHNMCSLLLAMATMLMASGHAAEVMILPSGQTVFVTLYRDNILRLKVQPTAGDFYRVTDVVVADKEAADKLKVSCATATSCLVEAAKASMTVTGHDLDSDTAHLIVEYRTGGVVSTISKVPVAPQFKDAPELTTTFPTAKKLFGLPQHAMDLALKEDVTYQLYNLDVFHYKLDDPGGIYGSIPFLMAHSSQHTTGVLFLNSAEMNVRILKSEEEANGTPGAHWKAEVGIVDVFFLGGANPSQVHEMHAYITGKAYLPPMFSLGYHQCRWNYRSTDDCLDVDAGFDQHNIPYDVLWLDIEHTDGKKYFTWDLHNFPEPTKLINSIAAKGRKMVTIKDPHIKRENGYHVHDEATSKGFYVKTESGSDYEGHCWPGTSSWIDFHNKDARDWYATLFKHDRYGGSTPDLYTWIDMNEPSVFNSHQVTMDRNAVHRSASGKQVKHRYLHNMYGYLHTMAAFQGHLLSSAGAAAVKRPFILTRSFFSGSQRYSAMWTGDNMAKWDHLEKSLPMLLSLSLANYPFVGADCGGFFFNPEAELMVRWIQAGIFYPFFRAHAHLETKRREPWLFGEDSTSRIRAAIAIRYSMLPYLYTTFFQTHALGTTVIRPLFYEFPAEENLFSEQNTYMFGPSLLVSPIVREGEVFHMVRFPSGAFWYDWFTGKKMESGTDTNIAVTMDTIPIYTRGGSIIPTKQRLRRSSAAMVHDPLTLYVSLDERGNSYGELYTDDEDTYNFESGAFLHRALSFSAGRLTCRAAPTAYTPKDRTKTFQSDVYVERVVIFGLSKEPRRIAATSSNVGGNAADGVATATELTWSKVHDAIVVRQPKTQIAADWDIVIEF